MLGRRREGRREERGEGCTRDEGKGGKEGEGGDWERGKPSRLPRGWISEGYYEISPSALAQQRVRNMCCPCKQRWERRKSRRKTNERKNGRGGKHKGLKKI